MNVFETNGHSRQDTLAVNSYGKPFFMFWLIPVVPAIRGLFQSVRSRETPEKMIKALLRLVTLWFRYGESPAVLVEVEQQLTDTSISAWLMAIPQLIARLGTRHKELQGVLINLLKNIASQYPHAVIWPLLTASQTRKPEHEDAARTIMDFICTMPDGTRLVLQAKLVGRELIRASISWMEKWRNVIDRCLPRQDLMEIAWHEIPILWEDEIEQLSVSGPSANDGDLLTGRCLKHQMRSSLLNNSALPSRRSTQSSSSTERPGILNLSIRHIPSSTRYDLSMNIYLTNSYWAISRRNSPPGNSQVQSCNSLVLPQGCYHSEIVS